MRSLAALSGVALASAALSACDADTATPAPVTLTFEATVGHALSGAGPAAEAVPFACDRTYPGLGLSGRSSGAAPGSSGSTLAFSDLRLYVSEVALLGPDGAATPVALVPEAPWQSDRVALLDFEDATGGCSNGTPATRTTVVAEDPGHPVTGVRLTLGVPADLNHGDASTAASPLDLTGLFWSWNAGYKFLRLDATVDGARAFNFHLGSVGCTRGADATVTCARPNRAVLTLTGFDPATTVIRLDVAALLSNLDLAADAGGAPGCMASPEDPECGPLFSALGLDAADPDAAPGPQVFATVAPR